MKCFDCVHKNDSVIGCSVLDKRRENCSFYVKNKNSLNLSSLNLNIIHKPKPEFAVIKGSITI